MSITKQIAAKLFGADRLFARRTYGGIQPQSYKEHSMRSRIMTTPIPPLLTIPVGTETTGAVTLLVSPGEHVHKFQKLAIFTTSKEAYGSIPVHAPISGTVTAIENAVVADHTEQEQLCIALSTDGKDEAQQVNPSDNYAKLSSPELIALIHAAGITGMGGTGVPTAKKLSDCQGSAIEFLIINAAECEPYITADEALIRERAKEVIIGAKILQQASQARRCIIAIENTKLEAIEALKQALTADGNCELIIIPGKYPSGSERQLIQCLTGINLAANQQPTDHGVLVQNAGTAYASYKAIIEGEPCISRITTLCGQALKTPKNFEALIGSSADFLFTLCGIDTGNKQRSILGGTLTGKELSSDEAVTCKTTNCLIATNKEELQSPIAEQPCIRCGFCADVCPAKLLPQQLLMFSKATDTTQLLEHGLFDCIECGACDYVCPSQIPLVSFYQESKKSIQDRAASLERSEYWQQRFQFRQYRIKKNKEQSLNKKPIASVKPSSEVAQETKKQNDEQKVISKEQASRDIAAAVARVKARRSEKKE